MVSTCQDCGQKFLSSSEYMPRRQTHLQTHLDKWNINAKAEAKNFPPPDGMNPALLKVFEKYNFDEKAVLCLSHKGQLNTVIREPSLASSNCNID